MDTQFIQTPAKKKQNITPEANRIISKILLMSAGKAMLAPASNSPRRISTGLNQ